MNLERLEQKARRLEVVLERYIRTKEKEDKILKLFNELNSLWQEVEQRTRLELFGKVITKLMKGQRRMADVPVNPYGR